MERSFRGWRWYVMNERRRREIEGDAFVRDWGQARRREEDQRRRSR